jgi:predicted RNA-binding Zn-ribbon protein involved in translation (DUF1610 family)
MREGPTRAAPAWAALIGYWTGDAKRARDTAGALVAFTAFQSAAHRSRPSAQRLTAIAGELERRAKIARAALDRDFEDGLRRRIGTWIAPQAVVDLYPRDGDDMIAFALVRDLRRAVTPSLPPAAVLSTASAPTKHALLDLTSVEMPQGIAVCEGCTIVFEPQRKAYARHCPRCGKRAPTRASFLERDPEPGETVPVRVPELERGKWLHDGLKRWRTVYFGRCIECRRPFTATRKDKKYCGDGERCGQKHRRRDAA